MYLNISARFTTLAIQTPRKEDVLPFNVCVCDSNKITQLKYLYNITNSVMNKGYWLLVHIGLPAHVSHFKEKLFVFTGGEANRSMHAKRLGWGSGGGVPLLNLKIQLTSKCHVLKSK